jgi:hypothetical protein
MIIDPTNPDNALDTDGELMGAVRMVPIVENLAAPTLAELQGAPIIGYARPDAFKADDDDAPLPSTYITGPRSVSFTWKIKPDD